MRRIAVAFCAILLSLPLGAAEPVLWHLPKDRLEHPVLFGSRIVEVNRPMGKVFAAGQRNARPVLMSFQRDSTGVFLVPAGYQPFIGSGKLLKYHHVHTVFFPVVEESSDALTLDISRYFYRYPSQVSAIPPRVLREENQRSHSCEGTSETPDYLMVNYRYCYESGLDVTAACYVLFLPDEPMPARTVDPGKAGYNAVDIADASGWRHASSQRWNLSRNRSLVFYVDRAFPAEWFPYIKEGLEDWNQAFEACDLGKVITVLPEPDGLDRNSPLVNMVRYMDVDEANAKGDVLCDPRSGEILQGDILWWRNVKDLIEHWRYLQTGAADPAALAEDYPMEMLGPMIRYSVCHEMGHVLGLSHNMGGSWSYPADSLRSPSFTRRYGTTASVMDYARYNHLATARDVEKGVNLLPPRIGPYDYYAIALGYAPEKAVYNRYCYFAPAISAAISPDPSAQTETLSNDLLASSKAGLRNCRILLKDESITPERRLLLRSQYYRYIQLALSNIGGSVKGKPVSARVQRHTVAFVLDGLRDIPSELRDEGREKLILNELTGRFLPERVLKTRGLRGLRSYYRELRLLNVHYRFPELKDEKEWNYYNLINQ